ncbi:MAG: alkaline phosphatase family protein, partial [Candidatus Aminicenantales bacterium]
MSTYKTSRSLSRRDFMKIGAAASAAVGFGTAKSFVPKVYGKARAAKKVIVIGMDGLDHGLVKGWIDAGKLPTFEKVLRAGGDIRPLRSSIPPQSPVAWSNFIAGTDPGGHGIFDFIHRNPQALNINDFMVFSAAETTAARHTLRIGQTILPLSGGGVRNLRGGKAFWQNLEEHDIPSTVIRMPSNYPPVATRQRTLSGMNTPDLKG